MSRRLPMPLPGFGEVLSSRLGRRYAAGPDVGDVLTVAADLRSAGRLVSCDYVAHPARTTDEAEVAAQRLGDLVAQFALTGLARGASPGTAAVDLMIPGGALGWGTAGEARLRRLCAAAAAAGSCVTVRPRSVGDVEACLDLVHRVRGEFEDTGIELWASLRRTAGDLTALLPQGVDTGHVPPRVVLRTTAEGSRVPAPAVLPTAMDIDRAFVRYAKRLLGGAARPILAVPDATLVAVVSTLADEARATQVDEARAAQVAASPADPPPATPRVEFMIDMGRRGDEVTRLSATGRAVRVKVPFGPRWRAVGLRLGARPPRLARLSR